jgi:protein SCO1/2
VIRVLVLVLVLVLAPRAAAQPAPEAVSRSGITERVGAELPRDTAFQLAGGGAANISTFFDGKRPVLLVLAYARCTMLCSLVLRGVVSVARDMARQPGRDYQLVLVSLDAHETLDEAARKQATLLAQLGTDRAAWPYLVGSRASIDAVADALGFQYAWDARTEQYAHPAVIFALTPDGRVARYLHGVQFDPIEVAAALEDAAANRTSAVTEAIDVLRCFRFDPASRRVGARAQRFLRVGAAVVLLFACTGLALLVLWERQLRRRS